MTLQAERYHYKGQLCTRYKCTTVSCPTPQPIHCGPGQTSSLQTYTYKGQSCRRYQCTTVSCPTLSKPSCTRSQQSYQERYTYKGVTCTRWKCRNSTPLTTIPNKRRKPAGRTIKLQPIRRGSTLIKVPGRRTAVLKLGRFSNTLGRIKVGRTSRTTPPSQVPKVKIPKGCPQLRKAPRCRRGTKLVPYPTMRGKKKCYRWACLPFICPSRRVRKKCRYGISFMRRIKIKTQKCVIYNCKMKSLRRR